jgi:dual specificity tyrosine-phosphorylation-regulated kinase 2/3/4
MIIFFFWIEEDRIFTCCLGRSKRGKLRGPPGSKDLSQALKNCDDPLFIDFLKRCFEWDPQVRITPAQALR